MEPTRDDDDDGDARGNTFRARGATPPVRGLAAVLALVVVALGLRDVRRTELEVRRLARPRSPEAVAVVAAVGGPLRVIRGRVAGVAHEPIANAHVAAVLVLEDRSYPLAEGYTDAQGGFALSELPEGSYWLIARADGRARRAAQVRLAGQDLDAPELVLGTGAAISGSVANAPAHGHEARPLEGVVVRAVSDGGGGDGPPYATRTDATGAFVLDGLPPGSYRVELLQAGFEAVTRRAVPAPARGLTVALRELAGVRGVVRNGAGQPVPAADVLLAGSGVWPPRATPARADGTFEIVGIPAGVYEVRASEGAQVAEPVAPLVLEPGDVRDVSLVLTPGLTLVGAITDAANNRPIAGARVVVAEDALSTSPRALVADASGSFRVTGLLRRPHQVSATAPGYVPRVGALAVPGGAPVQVQLDRAVVLAGRVVDGRGAPVSGAQIEVIARDLDGRPTWLTAAAVAFRDALFAAQARGPRPLIPAGELGVMPGPVPIVPVAPSSSAPAMPAAPAGAPSTGYVTDAAGRFRIEGVPPGVASVAASHPAFVRGETAQLSARAGETLDVEIVLHQGGTIDGRLVDERGFPIAAQIIEVRSEREPYPRRAFTQQDGTFRIPAVLGRVAVVAMIGGRAAARAEVDVADDQVVPVTLTLTREIARVRGRVVDERGFPVRAAEVVIARAQDSAGSVRTLSTDDGTFDTLVPGGGGLVIEVRHPEFAPRLLRVAASNDDVPVVLEPGGGVAVEVRGRACATGEVSVELRTTCGPVRRTVRGDGEVRAEHLCPGRVNVVASAAGCVRTERAATVSAGRTTDLSPMELGAGGGASGDVVDSNGEPVPGAVVALLDAPADTTTGSARTDRRGLFVVGDLPDGDHQLIATHPLLGRSAPAPVRIWRGSLARGLRLQFDHELASATREARELPVTFVLREGHVEVRAVVPDSAPARAGLSPGDQVVSVQGMSVATPAQASARIQGPLGDEVTVEAARDGVRRLVRWTRELER